ncbi:MAG: hypothetical protein ACREF7_01235 [Candidatus Saccharimonadales bacterium]
MRRRWLFITLAVIFAALLIGLHYVRSAILDNAPVPSFSYQPVATAVISSLQNSGSPVKDFDIVSNVSVTPGWNVVRLKAVGIASDLTVAVVKFNGNSYSLALGPGNQFQASSLSKLPPSVQYYLYTQDLVLSGAE